MTETQLKRMYNKVIYPCNGYTMVCPPVQADNPQALGGASQISHGIIILYRPHQCMKSFVLKFETYGMGGYYYHYAMFGIAFKVNSVI